MTDLTAGRQEGFCDIHTHISLHTVFLPPPPCFTPGLYISFLGRTLGTLMLARYRLLPHIDTRYVLLLWPQ